MFSTCPPGPLSSGETFRWLCARPAEKRLRESKPQSPQSAEQFESARVRRLPCRRQVYDQIIELSPHYRAQKLFDDRVQHGPRQISGLSPGFRRPTEMTLRPCASMGSMRLSPRTLGWELIPSMSGTFGRKRQHRASRPCAEFGHASARFTASVVFPTPPLPEPTAIIVSTPGRAAGLAVDRNAAPWVCSRDHLPILVG